MRYAVTFACVLFVATPAAAEILLAEFEFAQAEPVTLPASYTFLVRKDSVPAALWFDTIDSVPVTQTASAELVAQFNAVATNNHGQTRWVFMVVCDPAITVCQGPIGNTTNAERNFDTIWVPDAIPGDGFRAESFVPYVLGTFEHHHNAGLWGYIVTGLERTITADSQLVQIYGHPIPEPAAWLLACLALCCVLRQRKR